MAADRGLVRKWLSGLTAGVVTALKAVTADSNKDVGTFRNITLSGNIVQGSNSLSETDLAKIDGITNGTVAVGKAIVPTTGKVIDELDIYTLKKGGTAIAASGAEINKACDGIDTAATSHMPQIAEADIAYTDSATALFTIPDGAKIYSISIYATTGFDGTTPTYDVGFAANPDAILDGATLPSSAGAATGTSAPSATVTEWTSGVTSGVLIGTFVGGGSNTTGAGKIRMAFYT